MGYCCGGVMDCPNCGSRRFYTTYALGVWADGAVYQRECMHTCCVCQWRYDTLTGEWVFDADKAKWGRKGALAGVVDQG